MTKTQYEHARAGDITPAMERVAERERCDPDVVRSELAAGRAVIPANPNHEELDPIIIGRAFATKVNANIGTSEAAADLTAERQKLRTALEYGADTVMDLSTEGDLDQLRTAHIADSPAPVGTVPVYAALTTVDKPADLTADALLEEIERQAKQGVDYMTIHAGIRKHHLPLVDDRTTGIVSRGGSILAAWMDAHDRENPLYTAFDEICACLQAHDVTISLGDGLRPGAIADAGDDAQVAELETLGELTRQARSHGVQVMIEGPGHMPADMIAEDVQRQQQLCDGAPYYVLGPVVTDVAPGYDHITSAIGGTIAAQAGAAMLCYVTPAEHLGLPDEEDVRRGLVATRIAAHAADVATGAPHDWDDALSRARAAFQWDRQFALAIDPERARTGHDGAETTDGAADQARFCSMCGVEYCSMRIDQDRRDESPDSQDRSSPLVASTAAEQNRPPTGGQFAEQPPAGCPVHDYH